ncbi:hypothetical protein PG993_015222 [Apiospora rasikravindrae]|uniref:Uncharacterized protein n=1 Tax=Apiospora rasikravindrae TaxID=990691 RepID=A0ABR1RQ23_9PEZI
MILLVWLKTQRRIFSVYNTEDFSHGFWKACPPSHILPHIKFRILHPALQAIYTPLLPTPVAHHPLFTQTAHHATEAVCKDHLPALHTNPYFPGLQSSRWLQEVPEDQLKHRYRGLIEHRGKSSAHPNHPVKQRWRWLTSSAIQAKEKPTPRPSTDKANKSNDVPVDLLGVGAWSDDMPEKYKK